jgi:hypothetical protein
MLLKNNLFWEAFFLFVIWNIFVDEGIKKFGNFLTSLLNSFSIETLVIKLKYVVLHVKLSFAASE